MVTLGKVLDKRPNILGITLARGGSKSIPEKNITLLEGQPLINYTINEAKKSSYLTDYIVSTDSIKIANIAKECARVIKENGVIIYNVDVIKYKTKSFLVFIKLKSFIFII